jgi:steroid 5-alpha reductase family enzyme
VAGVILWLVAIGGESIADMQLALFKAQPAAKGRVCDIGLWKYSRHPNYFFEWLGWLAYPAIAFDPAQLWTWVTWIAPIVMFILLRFATGVPATEKSMLASRGDKFRDYQRRVSAFFPLPPKGKTP